MDRYSYIYGTDERGVYAPLGASDGLYDFLNSVGVVNFGKVIDTVKNTLTGFMQLPEGKNPSPVAVCYAPMHLGKREDMRGVRSFAAIGITGNEQTDRHSKYSQTVFIPLKLMYETVSENGIAYNYLDQIFGTYRLTWQDMYENRCGIQKIDLDALPEKIEPHVLAKDLAVVIGTCKAVYDEKTIVIRLEKNCDFHTRANQILEGIYSLLQPKLATEVGFAVCVEQDHIKRLAMDTSIKIFVIPSDYALDAVSWPGAAVFDLSASEESYTIEADPVSNALRRWNRLDWKRRQPVMEELFRDTGATYKSKELFAERTEAFFTDSFFQWRNSREDDGKIRSLEQLREKYESFPLCEKVEWIKADFVHKVPALLKPLKLKDLTSQALADALYGEDNSKKHYQELYLFGAKLGGVDTIAASRAVARKALDQAEPLHRKEIEKKNAELETLKIDSVRKLNDQRNIYENKLIEQQRQTANAVAQGKAEVEKAVMTGQAAVQAEKENTEAVRRAGEMALAAEKERTAEAIAAGEKAVKDVREEGLKALESVRQNAALAIVEVNNQLKAEQEKTARAVEEGRAAVEAEKANTEAVRQNCQQAVKAAQDRANLEIDRLKSDLRGEQEKTAQALMDNRKVSAELEELRKRIKQFPNGLSNEDVKTIRQVPKLRKQLEDANLEVEKYSEELRKLKNKTFRLEEKNKSALIKTIIAGLASFLVSAIIFGILLFAIKKPEAGVKVPEESEPTSSVAETDAVVPTIDTAPTETVAVIPTIDTVPTETVAAAAAIETDSSTAAAEVEKAETTDQEIPDES